MGISKSKFKSIYGNLDFSGMVKKQKEKAEAAADQALKDEANKNLEASKKNNIGSAVKGFGVGLAEGASKGLVDIGEGVSNLVESAVTGKVSDESKKKFADARGGVEQWGADNGSNDVGDFIGNLPGSVVKGVSDWSSYMARGARNLPEGVVAGIAAGSDDKFVKAEGIKKQKEIQENVFGKDVASRGDTAMVLEGVSRPVEGIIDVATGGIGSKVIKGATKQGAKEITKTTAKAAVTNAATNVPISIAQQAARGQEITPGSIAKEAAIQAVTGGVLAGAGKAKAVSKANKAIDADVKVKTEADVKQVGTDRLSQLDKEATDAYINSRKQEFGAFQTNKTIGDKYGSDLKALPEGTRTLRTSQDIAKELSDVQNATGKYAKSTPEARTEAFQALRSELDIATKQESRNDFVMKQDETINTPDPKDIESQIAAIDNNEVPELKTPHPKVKDLYDVATSKAIPAEVKVTAVELLDTIKIIDDRLSALTTPESAQSSHLRMDEAYKVREAEIAEMPLPRQEIEIQKLDEQYMNDLNELESKLEADKAEVDDLTIKRDHLNSKEQQLVAEIDTAMTVNPKAFEIQDEAKATEMRTQLERTKEIQTVKENMSPTAGQLTASAYAGVKPSESTNPATIKAVIDTDTGVSNLTNTGKNPTVFDYVAGAPREVMKKWGEAGAKISDALSTAYDSISARDAVMTSQVGNWYKRAGKKDGMEQIAKALDGDIDSFSSLTKPQVDVFNEVRDMFNAYADELGLPTDARIKDYLPHIMNGEKTSDVDRALMQLALGKNAEGKPLTGAEITKLNSTLKGISYEALDMIKRNSMYTVKNGFLEKRLGAEDYSFNLADIIQTYTHSAHETIHLKPAFESVKNIANSDVLTSQQMEYTAKVIQSMKTRPTSEMSEALTNTLNSIWKGKDTKFSTVSAKARKLVYDATMGANVGAAIRNLSQGSNTYAKLGEKYYAHGTAAALRSLKHSNGLYDEALRAGVLHNKYSDLVRTGGDNKLQTAADTALWSMFTSTERINRLTAYFGEKQKYLDSHPEIKTKTAELNTMRDTELNGITDVNEIKKINNKYDSQIFEAEADAVKAGRNMSKKTQFEFGVMDAPLAMQGDIAKIVTQFQSYNVAQVKFLKSMIAGDTDSMFVKQADGKYKMTAQGTANMARLIGSNLLFQSTIGTAALGMTSVGELFDEDADVLGKTKDIITQGIPFANELEEGKIPQSPLLKLMFGNEKTAGITTIGSDIASGDVEKLGKDTMSLGSSAFGTLVPGGSQVKKTLDAADTNMSGYSKNDSGSIRFKQDADPASQLQSLILGQYSTKAGSDWIKDEFPTLSPAQSEKVMKASDAMKERTFDLYAGFQKVKAKSSIKDNIVETMKTRPNRADSLITEHNAEVMKAKNAHIRKYGSLSKDEEKYINNTFFIDTKNKNDYNKDE